VADEEVPSLLERDDGSGARLLYDEIVSSVVEARGALPDGTYELIGSKALGNPEHVEAHTLVPHGVETLPDVPRDFVGLRAYLETHEMEGVVFWRISGDPDCETCKFKRRDFGLPWPVTR
jgi:hypothetical protein